MPFHPSRLKAIQYATDLYCAENALPGDTEDRLEAIRYVHGDLMEVDKSMSTRNRHMWWAALVVKCVQIRLKEQYIKHLK